jgi:hypothetical protein
VRQEVAERSDGSLTRLDDRGDVTVTPAPSEQAEVDVQVKQVGS